MCTRVCVRYRKMDVFEAEIEAGGKVAWLHHLCKYVTFLFYFQNYNIIKGILCDDGKG